MLLRVQILDDCVSALAETQHSEVTDSVEHIVKVGRPVVALNEHISFLFFLGCISLDQRLQVVFLFRVRSQDGVSRLEFRFVLHLVIERISALWQDVFDNHNALLVRIDELDGKTRLAICLSVGARFTEDSVLSHLNLP